jgi:hypothetical protein
MDGNRVESSYYRCDHVFSASHPLVALEETHGDEQ